MTARAATASHRAGAATYRDALRNREFRGLVIAQVASEWGDNIARVALASLVLARTDSAFLAVLAFVVSFVPAVFGSALLGAAADRLPRKVVLLGCDLVRAVVITVLAFVAVDGTPVWVLLALLLVAEMFTAPFEAAQRAVVPDVLPDPRGCLAGTGLMRVLYQVDQVVGISPAGLVIVLVGERAGLLIDAATFARVVRGARGDAALATGRAGAAGGHRRCSTESGPAGGWCSTTRRCGRSCCSAGVRRCSSSRPEAVALAYARDDGADPAVGAALMASLPAGAALGA